MFSYTYRVDSWLGEGIGQQCTMTLDLNPSLPSLPSDHAAGALHRFTHDAMACRWGIWIVGEDRDYAGQTADAAFEEVDRLEAELSRFVQHSDIARINALEPGQSLRIGVDAFECLQLAAEIHVQTNGAFDVTYRADFVDLGGIGKGYAIDRAVSILRDWGVESALVHSGQSTLFALGAPPDSDAWTVSIRDPIDHASTLGTVRLRDRALSGSGALLHGQHIINPRAGDPRTGEPAEEGRAGFFTRRSGGTVVGAWSVAPSAALADALSTAFMVLAPEEVERFCRGRTDVNGLLCSRDSGGITLRRYGCAFDSP